jgi:hypothetical protein
MQPHRHRAEVIGLADDDRHLIAQALAAAKHDEFGVGRAVERHWRAPDDVEGFGAGDAVAAHIGDSGGQQPAPRRSAGRGNHQGRRQYMSQSQKFERAEMDRRRRGHGRIDARSDALRQGVYSGEVDRRHSDEARLPPIEAQLSQTRSG